MDIIVTLLWASVLFVATITCVIGCMQPENQKRRKKGQPRQPSRGEQECARVLKILFPMHEFACVRPDWLKNPETGRNLEADLFCELLKLDVEHHGAHHRRYVPFFHPNGPIDHDKQKAHDALRRQRMAAKGIDLIEVWDDEIKLHQIESYLTSHSLIVKRRIALQASN